MTFSDYVDDWFSQLLKEEFKGNEERCRKFMEDMGFTPIGDYLDEGETAWDFLNGLTDENNDIYGHAWRAFEYQRWTSILLDRDDFLREMFNDVAKEDYLLKDQDFVEPLIDDMVDHCDGYDNPIGFFKDLSYGGCASGMVGMFIYHSDCKEFYIRHIDSMEDFKAEFEEELGDPIRNKEKLPHYTFMCWLCYEETAYRIAQALWPEQF